MGRLKISGQTRGVRAGLARRMLALLLTVFFSGCEIDLADKRAQIQALDAVANGAVFIDVRSPEEVALGSFDNAINIPHGDIVRGVTALALDKQTPIVVFCRSGNRSGKAKAALDAAGYHLVINGGAYDDLRAVQLALERQR